MKEGTVFKIQDENRRIILFDGVCNYCNTMVNLVITFDKKNIFRFATIQSEVAQRLIAKFPKETANINSFIYIENDKCYTYSEAVGMVLLNMNWYIHILGKIWLLIPFFLREKLYKWIAKNRYKWFGEKEQCMIPDEKVRSRFLS